jgi:hypothetical protein
VTGCRYCRSCASGCQTCSKPDALIRCCRPCVLLLLLQLLLGARLLLHTSYSAATLRRSPCGGWRAACQTAARSCLGRRRQSKGHSTACLCRCRRLLGQLVQVGVQPVCCRCCRGTAGSRCSCLSCHCRRRSCCSCLRPGCCRHTASPAPDAG